jgi:hypothetical protein
MLLITHIIIALASLVYAGFTFTSPGELKFKISFGLIAATLASGTVLVASTNSNFAAACGAGLLYLGFVTAVLLFANYKFIKSKSNRLFANSLLEYFSH